VPIKIPQNLISKTIFGRRNHTILVHQMGKVGSRTIISALEKLDKWKVVQLHQLNEETLAQTRKMHSQRGLRIPLHVKEAERIKRKLMGSAHPIIIISMVREPISRNFSAFFQNLDFHNINFKDLTEADIYDVINTFLHKYNHDVPLNWFDLQVKIPLGIDVYQYPFPHQTGYQVISKDQIRLLIMKCETDDDIKVSAISRFLGIEPFDMPRTNIGNNKDYAQIYKAFKRKIQLPDEYIQRMYESRYTRHFFKSNEIEEFKQYWNRRRDSVES